MPAGRAADGAQPPPPAPADLPPPLPEGAFGPGFTRMPRLGDGFAQFGETPRPTPEGLADFRRFVTRTIDPQNTMDLVQGRTRLLILSGPPRRTQVADERIATTSVISPAELSVLGNRVGTTVLNLWFADPADPARDKVLSYLVRVIPDPEAKERLERAYEALGDEINRAFPDSVVRLRLVGDKVVITGQAKDAADAAQILRIVRANAPNQGPGGQGGVGGARAADIPVDAIDPTGPIDPEEVLGPQGLRNFVINGGPNVINLMRIPGEQQVMLRVVVAEVNRAAARSIGLNFSVTNRQGVTVFSNTTGSILGQSIANPGFGAATVGTNNLAALTGRDVSLAISALRNLSYARSLAEPNLVTLNGQPARFQAGGSFPVPVVSGFTAAGLQGVSFVPFGVQLVFTPLITDRDRIRLSVQAAVSTRDLQTGNSTVSGSSVPNLNTRNFQTTIELREGQTMAIAGLIQNNMATQSERIPFFGDLPLLSTLTGYSQTQAAEQELVVLITPELVHPLDPKELTPLPGSDLFEPGDLEFYLLGRMESRRPYDYRSPVRNDIDRMIRYRRCEDIYITGPHGHTPQHP